MIRARFCELLSSKVPHGDSDLFLMGLMSGMDAILDVPMADLVEKLPLDQETKAVLLGKGSPLRPLYQLMLARESGEWQSAGELAGQLHLNETEVAEAYWQAMHWAREVSAE
jgi:EAL and modified HD-GYP domain-containing signal transduction protein